LPAGLLAAGLSACFSSSKDLISKKLAFRLDGTVSTFASFTFALPFYVLFLAVQFVLGDEVVTLSLLFWQYVILRSVTDSFAEGLKMHAFAYGDVSVVACFFALSPIFLIVFAPFITNDELTPIGVMAVLLSVVGTLVMVYEPSRITWKHQKKGILLATAAAVFFALNSCFDRQAVKVGAPVFSAFSMTLVSAFIILPLVAFRRGTWRALQEQTPGLLVRGLLEVVFMTCKLLAMRELGHPAYVVSIMRLSLILSIVAGRVIFKEGDFGRRLAAGTLILFGALLIPWEKPLWELVLHLGIH
jgi:drug/metabolite transporter (DMT)-like permease